jgi:hypothetical protein
VGAPANYEFFRGSFDYYEYIKIIVLFPVNSNPRWLCDVGGLFLATDELQKIK